MTPLAKAKAAARASYSANVHRPKQPKRPPISSEPRGKTAALIGWERSTPRCANCKVCTPAKTILNRQTTTLPVVLVPPVCTRGNFYTREGAVCDSWVGSDGSTLEGTTP